MLVQEIILEFLKLKSLFRIHAIHKTTLHKTTLSFSSNVCFNIELYFLICQFHWCLIVVCIFLLQAISKMSLPKETVNDSKIESLEGFFKTYRQQRIIDFNLVYKQGVKLNVCFAPAKRPLFEDKNKSPYILINNNVQVDRQLID